MHLSILVRAPIYRANFKSNIFQEYNFPLKRRSAGSEVRGLEVIFYQGSQNLIAKFIFWR